MSEPFVPFASKLPSADATEPFHVKILPGDSGHSFQPLAGPGSTSTSSAAQSQHAGRPEVSLVRDGDRVTAIRVQCACGECIELQCVY